MQREGHSESAIQAQQPHSEERHSKCTDTAIKTVPTVIKVLNSRETAFKSFKATLRSSGTPQDAESDACYCLTRLTSCGERESYWLGDPMNKEMPLKQICGSEQVYMLEQ